MHRAAISAKRSGRLIKRRCAFDSKNQEVYLRFLLAPLKPDLVGSGHSSPCRFYCEHAPTSLHPQLPSPRHPLPGSFIITPLESISWTLGIACLPHFLLVYSYTFHYSQDLSVSPPTSCNPPRVDLIPDLGYVWGRWWVSTQ